MKKLLVFLLCFTLLIPSFSISAKDNVYSLDDMSEDKLVDFIYEKVTDFDFTQNETKYFSDKLTDGYNGDYLYSAILNKGYDSRFDNEITDHTYGCIKLTFCIKKEKRAKSIYEKLYKKLNKYNKIIDGFYSSWSSTYYSLEDLYYMKQLGITTYNKNIISEELKKQTTSTYYQDISDKYAQTISTYCPLSMSKTSTGYVIIVTCYEPLAITSPGEEIDIDDSAKFDLGELEDTPEFKLSNTKGYKLKITFDSKDNYEIQIATDKSFKNVVKEESITAANKTYTLEKGTYYVRAKYTIDNQSSDWSEVKTIKIKK